MDIDNLLADYEKEQEAKTETKRDTRVLLPSPAKKAYKLRLIPNLNTDPPQLFKEEWVIGFKNPRTDKYVYGGTHEKTFGKDFDSYYSTIRNELFDRDDKKHAILLYPNPRTYVNVYVVEDPNNSENNGTIMALRYNSKAPRDGVADSGSPVHLGILEGKEEYKGKIFQATKGGVEMNLKVKEGKFGHKYEVSWKEDCDAIPNGAEIMKGDSEDLFDLDSFIEAPFDLEKQKAFVAKNIFGKIASSGSTDDEPLPGIDSNVDDLVDAVSDDSGNTTSVTKVEDDESLSAIDDMLAGLED